MPYLFDIVLLLPVLSASLLLLFPKSGDGGQRKFALLAALSELLLLLFALFNNNFLLSQQHLLTQAAISWGHGELMLLTFGAIIVMVALVLSPVQIVSSYRYYAFIMFGEALSFWVICSTNEILTISFFAVFCFLQFLMAGFWAGANNQALYVQKRAFFQGSAVLLLLLGTQTDGTVSVILLLCGALLLMPLFPLPRWYKIWNQAPLGLVALELLQVLIAYNFIYSRVWRIFVSHIPHAAHYLAVTTMILAVLAAISALRQEDLEQLADMSLRTLVAMAVALLFISETQPSRSGFLLLAAALFSYLFIHWLNHCLKERGSNLLIVRCRGLAGVIPIFSLCYILAVASFTVLPLFSPLWATMQGLLAGRWNVVYFLLAILALFFLSAAEVRGIIRLSCGTPSVNFDNGVADFSRSEVATCVLLLLVLILLNVVGGLSS